MLHSPSEWPFFLQMALQSHCLDFRAKPLGKGHISHTEGTLWPGLVGLIFSFLTGSQESGLGAGAEYGGQAEVQKNGECCLRQPPQFIQAAGEEEERWAQDRPKF